MRGVLDMLKKVDTSGPWVLCKKCNNRIRSEHRHDFRWCPCKSLAVDGGGDYLKLSFSGNPEESYEIIEDHVSEDHI